MNLKALEVTFWWILLFFASRTSAFAPTFRQHHVSSSPQRQMTAGADIEQETEEESISPLSSGIDGGDSQSSSERPRRGKVNEIDFCIAPADVSLSRSYSSASSSTDASKTLSLTRALNNASNRVVRRILLARSWPSAEALNLSLRQVLAAEKQTTSDIKDGPKCPIPRPILNILVRRRGEKGSNPIPRSRTDEEYVADQLTAFRERYSAIPGYAMAEAYLECILSLATSGMESPRVSEVIEAGVYDESYRRLVAVLKSVGTVFEKVPGNEQLRRISETLVNQDICLSMLDKMNMKKELLNVNVAPATNKEEEEIVVDDISDGDETETSDKDEQVDKNDPKFRPLKLLLRRSENSDEEDEEFELDANDLGGVLLSAEEPSMTRQLNALSNIAIRALVFGGDQELLVLSETLEADKLGFVQRWYPAQGGEMEYINPEDETRPGVQYLNCIVQLLKDCYQKGIVTTLEPPLPLIQSYANAYERMMASLVELGSGYIKPVSDVMTMPAPRTAQEELGRFAVWESAFRSKNATASSSYPEDLEGSWEVKDEIGGETIGISTVVFRPKGKVEVAPPMQGLRWRLDPGPTHLDTVSFQVMGEEGTILQYRGFIDRGARLEARFSKRRIRVRGSVMFQMRDGDSVYLGDDYWKDMLPINYKTGTTKFVMTKNS